VALQPPHRKVTLMLSKLAYLTLCRSIQVFMLLARGDAAKDLEILVERDQLTVLRRHTPCPRLEPRGVPEVGQLSCRVVVFMDQAAEDITAAELLGDQRLRLAIAF
jgi:hypothetical protein